VLGLASTRDREPEIPLSMLELEWAQEQEARVEYLRRETGRSTGALRRALAEGPEPHRAARLCAACGNDDALHGRVLPFAGLIRDDDYGPPVVIRAGSACVTTGHERRQQIMLARQEGPTAACNRLHDPVETTGDIARLRALQAA